VQRESTEFIYDGWELDSPQDQPLIHDFFDYAQWFLFTKIRYRTILGLMLILMSVNNRGYLSKKGIYEDHVGVVRHYIRLYGAD